MDPFQEFDDDDLPAAEPSPSESLWGDFKPYSGTFLLKGYHPLAGGLLDDTTPLTWTKVHVHLKEPNIIVIKLLHEDQGFGGSFSREDSAGDTPTHRLGHVGEYDQQVRIDKHLTVTEIKKKNYSTDPSHSIYLEAFSIEKTKDFGVLPFDGLRYKRIKFGVPMSERDSLAEFRTRVIDICDKVREVPEEIGAGGIGAGGFLHGLVNRVTGGGGNFSQAF